MNTGEKIAKLRASRSWSQPQLAEQMSVSQSTVAMWESGKRKVSAEDLLKLSQIFHVTTDYLLGNNQTPKWANEKDANDLAAFLKDNAGSMTYKGENLTEDEKEKLEIAMTQIFWKRHKHD